MKFNRPNIPHKRNSIQNRVFFIITILILSIVSFTLISFNLLASRFTTHLVQLQLQDILHMSSQDSTPPPVPPIYQKPPLDPPPEPFPDMRKLPRTVFGRSDFVIITPDYEMVFPTVSMQEWKNLSEVNAFVQHIQNNHIDLDSEEVLSTKVGSREYYFVSIPTKNTSQTIQNYLLYFIDMTSLSHFVDQMNLVLGLIFIIAFVLAIFSGLLLSRYISRPIAQLTKFAKKIGERKFQPIPNQYKDKELYELAQSMNETAKQLDVLRQEETFFFQNVSHELRTPLQIIHSSAEGYLNRIIKAEPAMKSILQQVGKLTAMVSDLLYFSTMDSTKRKVDQEYLDVQMILKNSCESFLPLLKEKNIDIAYQFSQNSGLFYCEEKRITKAFSNLISNAIQHASSRIQVKCDMTENMIHISIENDGNPISDEDLPYIFDRFFKGKEGNYGIGLSIVKTIVEEYKGTLSVQHAGIGTSFSIMFPL
ncbi:MAG TPA: HAMP domain-containing sensor histidine kinase [Caldisericia bacterium]|mgnify:CR=1 FL=1|nr:HAMP domain-containing sensor histidine kinase [Caldisericia bacterium]